MVAEGGIKCWLGSAIPPAVVEEPFELDTPLYREHKDIHTVSGSTNIICSGKLSQHVYNNTFRSLSYTLDL